MLKLKNRNIAELPFEVLEQAHWRPAEAQLCCKYKPATKAMAEYQRLRGHWRQKEVNVNFSLDALLLSLRPGELGRYAQFVSGLDFGDARLVDGYCAELKKVIGVPDFVLSDSVNCILGENKLTASYSREQFVKYQSFANFCYASNELPSQIVHLVIVRDLDPNRFINDIGKSWRPALVNGHLVLDRTDEKSILETVHANVDSHGRINKFFNENECQLVRTVVLSWSQFLDYFDKATQRPDLRGASERLLEIASGTFDIEPSC